MHDLKQMAKAFKALANPHRLQIYLEVMRHHKQQRSVDYPSGCALTEFIGCLSVGAATVSHHLKELVNADLIRVERHGKFVNCHLNEEMSRRMRDFLEGID